jgi:hypothetical protein
LHTVKWSRIARRWALAVPIVALVLLGARGLWTAAGLPIALALLAVAVLAAFVRFNEIAGRIVGGVVLGALALFGVNVVVDNLFDWLHLGRLEIRVGLGFAVLVFGLVAAWYLRGSPPDEVPEAGAPVGWRQRVDRAVGRGSRWSRWTTLVIGFALAIFLILDVPVIVERRGDSVRPMALGVGLAVVLCGLGHACKRAAESGRQADSHANLFAAGAAAVVGLACLAFVPAALQRDRDRRRPVADQQPVPSLIDVRIVTDGSSHPAPAHVPPDPALRGFDVVYSVGYADGDTVHWTLVGNPSADTALAVASMGRAAAPRAQAPVTRDGADPVLVLLVDGTAPVIDGAPERLPLVTGRPDPRWRRVARAAREPRMPTYVLAQTTRRGRLDAWERVSGAFTAISIQVDRRRTATDAALALAIGTAGADDDLALAITHRPILLFDTGEPVPRPLSVEWLFAHRRVTLCRDRGVAKTECDASPTTDPRRLENNDTHIEIDSPPSAVLKALARREAKDARRTRTGSTPDVPGAPPPGVPTPSPALAERSESTPETAIYVHAVPVQEGRRRLVYLDYWWYLSDNPVNIGLKAFCGAGLVIPGVTCHSHRSDWEGMTVLVDRTHTPRVLSVRYAQHDTVIWYSWSWLRAAWSRAGVAKGAVAEAEGGTERPVAFVARGTHSTYPVPCRAACEQFAASGRGEDVHDGALPWIGNFTNTCGDSSCVHRLPTFEGGRQPALWNGFTGGWGRTSCALAYYCDSSEPPKAPGQQRRFRNPTRCTGRADANGRFRRTDTCED